MKKKWKFVLLSLLILFVACGREESSGRASKLLAKVPQDSEIDLDSIQASTGVPLEILKSETIGNMPRHKFLWIGLPQECPRNKIENLASTIIKDMIKRKPFAYHSFTIHFFTAPEIKRNLCQSKSFAKATYLPNGEWVKVGRVPLDDYSSYRLRCEFQQTP